MFGLTVKITFRDQPSFKYEFLIIQQNVLDLNLFTP